MSVLQRIPRIPEGKYLLKDEGELVLQPCVNSKSHSIPPDYWNMEKHEICSCTTCGFDFKKGHVHMFPPRFIEVQKTQTR